MADFLDTMMSTVFGLTVLTFTAEVVDNLSTFVFNGERLSEKLDDLWIGWQ
jgi:hypothetical protein